MTKTKSTEAGSHMESIVAVKSAEALIDPRYADDEDAIRALLRETRGWEDVEIERKNAAVVLARPKEEE